MSRKLIYKFLKDTLGVKVHQDLVPEKASLPAASYYIVSEPTEGPINGGIDLRRYNVTCDIIVDTSRLDNDELANKLKRLNNKTDLEDFQLFRVVRSGDTPRIDSNVKIFQSSIDLEFTMRRSELY